MCLGCHRLRAPVTVSCLFTHQMTALDCEFLSLQTDLEHIYHDLEKPVDIFEDDELKPAKLAAIFDSKMYDELNEKLAECVSSALKGMLSILLLITITVTWLLASDSWHKVFSVPSSGVSWWIRKA